MTETFTFTYDELIEFIEAIAALERAGQKFLIDYGYNNAVNKAKTLGLIC